MSARNTNQAFGWVAKSFHWLVFIGFVILFALGEYMETLPIGPKLFEIIALHKSIGIVVLALALLRLIWRFTSQSPALPSAMKPYETIAAHALHVLLYVVMIAMPLSGWAMSTAANFQVSVFGLFTLPSIYPPSVEAADFFKSVHGIIAKVIIALVVIHIGAALKHHFIEKDDVLKRMLPFSK